MEKKKETVILAFLKIVCLLYLKMSSESQFLVSKVYSLTIPYVFIMNFDHIHPRCPHLSHPPTLIFLLSQSLPPTLTSLFNDSAIQLPSVLQQQSEVSFIIVFSETLKEVDHGSPFQAMPFIYCFPTLLVLFCLLSVPACSDLTDLN